MIKNSVFLFSGQITNKIFSFIYTIFLAKALGVSNFGLYLVVLSYLSLFSTIVDLGISKYIIREVSLNKKKIPAVVTSSLVSRTIVILFFILLFTIIMSLTDKNVSRRLLIFISFFALVPQIYTLSIDSVFIGLQKTNISAVGSVISNFSTILIGITLISLGLGIKGGIYALILGQIVYVLYFLILLKKFNIKIRDKVDLQIARNVLIKSLPYGILGILGLMYFKIDTLILNYIKGDYQTGIYGAAYKFLEAVVFIPSVVSIAIFPSLTQMDITTLESAKKISLKIASIMLPLGIITALLYIVILPIIITILLPAYIKSLELIQILALSIPFMFLHVPISQIVITKEIYLKKVILLSLIPLLFNILFNFLFIPSYGYVAAAWITVGSDIFSLLILVAMIYILFNNTKINQFKKL